MTSNIRVGIGGWSYDPWRTTFYPDHVAKKDELEYASRKVTAIEVNSTFYRMQKPHVYAKWRDTTPEGFIFSLKAPRFTVQRKVLAEAAKHVQRFVDSGISELHTRLGPILWQLDPARAFDLDDLTAFLECLPQTLDSQRLRHAIEVRHRSFATPDLVDLARRHNVAVVFTDDPKYPCIADATADFRYARLRCASAAEPNGYSADALKQWARICAAWRTGTEANLPRLTTATAPPAADVFVFFINGAKERAPAAAMALIAALQA